MSHSSRVTTGEARPEERVTPNRRYVTVNASIRYVEPGNGRVWNILIMCGSDRAKAMKERSFHVLQRVLLAYAEIFLNVCVSSCSSSLGPILMDILRDIPAVMLFPCMSSDEELSCRSQHPLCSLSLRPQTVHAPHMGFCTLCMHA